MKISVLTPSFNTGKFLKRAIDSVMMQSYKNWEHIVVDGLSTDYTVEILKEHLHLNWISEKDQGQSDAMNKAFAMSSGDVIVYLNADDEFLEGAFESIVKEFIDNSTVDAVIGNLLYKDDQYEVMKVPKMVLDDILHYECFNFPANPVSYFYRRKVQLEIGEFPISNHFTMDYWFLLRMYNRFHLHYIDRVLGIFHGTGENKSSDVERSKRHLRKVRQNFLVKCFKVKYFPVVLKDLFSSS
jgi:glycosyltransferase involved in cell wall biosynthesis